MPNQKIETSEIEKDTIGDCRSTFNMPLRLSVLSMNYKKIYPIP